MSKPEKIDFVFIKRSEMVGLITILQDAGYEPKDGHPMSAFLLRIQKQIQILDGPK